VMVSRCQWPPAQPIALAVEDTSPSWPLPQANRACPLPTTSPPGCPAAITPSRCHRSAAMTFSLGDHRSPSQPMSVSQRVRRATCDVRRAEYEYCRTFGQTASRSPMTRDERAAIRRTESPRAGFGARATGRQTRCRQPAGRVWNGHDAMTAVRWRPCQQRSRADIAGGRPHRTAQASPRTEACERLTRVALP
jgi:hypothetical protein